MHTIYVSVSGGQLSVQPLELIEDNVTMTDKDALVPCPSIITSNKI
jgi:hypothetical protein